MRPVVFHSGKFKDAEKRWPIRDKELYAIVNAFEEYRHFLQDNSAGTIKVYSDHRTLATCMDTTTKLTPRLARWMEKLSEYDFVIESRPGDTMVVPDSMTRRTQDGYEEKFGEYQPVLPRDRFNEKVLREVDTKPVEDWEGQAEITGKDAFGETAIISPQMDDTRTQIGRNYANRKTDTNQQTE